MPPTILDVGCGAGANTVWLLHHGYHVTAIDASENAIQRLMSQMRSHLNPDEWFRAHFRVADITCLPFGSHGISGIFDAAIDCCALQHVEDIGKALSEIHRMLEPGGWLFSIMATDEHATKAFPDGVFTRRIADELEITQMFHAAGFKVPFIGLSWYEDEEYGDICHWLVHARKP